MLSRREFFRGTLGAAGAQALAAASLAALSAPPIIDGLGEIRLEYEPALLDEIRSSGVRACVVTLGNPGLHGPIAWWDVQKEYEAYEAHIQKNPDRLSKATTTADIDRAVERGTLALLYYLQNAAPIQDDLKRLETLHGWGVRLMQLTYNTRNLLGDGCLERTNAGLSRFGLEVVRQMNELGMIVDVSHCGEATTLDALEFSRKPVSINHSGCKAVYDHPRNKSDEALRRMAERGGVIGIFQINPYLGGQERNTLEDYLTHLDHAVKVAGLEHVGIGSDREYRAIPDTAEEKRKLEDELARLGPATSATFRWPLFLSELNHPRRMETLQRALEQRGYKAAAREKILGGNFYRLFRETIG